jgi:hypothetical protein
LCLQSLTKIVLCQPNRVKGRFASALDPFGLARVSGHARACLSQQM